MSRFWRYAAVSAIVAAAMIIVLVFRGGERPEILDREGERADTSPVPAGHGNGRNRSHSRHHVSPCAEHPLWPEENAVRTYRMTVAETEATMRFTLIARRVDGDEAVDEYLVSISSDLMEEPIESRMLRRCSDAAGAEEMWTGVSFAGLSSEEQQGWRWPSQIHAGSHFAGELRRRILGQQQVIQRDHLVENVEEVSTTIGTFEAWRVQIEDHPVGGSQVTESTVWVAEGVGLVRLDQASALGRVTLELVDRGSAEGA